MLDLNKSLISHFKKHDENAINYVYKDTYQLLYHVSFSILNNREDAEDTVNESYIKILNCTDGIPKDPKAFVSYICTICKNLSFDLLRKRKNESFEEITDEKVATKDSYISPLLEEIRALLSKEQFDIFIYHGYYKLPFDSIGKIVEKSPQRCRGIYSEARKILLDHKEVLL